VFVIKKYNVLSIIEVNVPKKEVFDEIYFFKVFSSKKNVIRC